MRSSSISAIPTAIASELYTSDYFTRRPRPRAAALVVEATRGGRRCGARRRRVPGSSRARHSRDRRCASRVCRRRARLRTRSAAQVERTQLPSPSCGRGRGEGQHQRSLCCTPTPTPAGEGEERSRLGSKSNRKTMTPSSPRHLLHERIDQIRRRRRWRYRRSLRAIRQGFSDAARGDRRRRLDAKLADEAARRSPDVCA